ncbi:hypothetical protein [Streptomyces sp. NPDC017890]|uniref:hypothetical protein n=1 Tax=Streptomyces sp. NPDC017890 TaxID=3365015 RepID=UPI00379B39BB
MHAPTRPSVATMPLATGLLAVVTALIALATSLADGLETPAFLVLVAADLLIVLVMGVLLAACLTKNATVTQNATAGTDAARLERDLGRLDLLEPLRTDEANGERR